MRWGGNHGTPLRGATFAEGKVGQAFSFDGVNDYVEIPDHPSLNTAPFSIAFWLSQYSLCTVYADVIVKEGPRGDRNGFIIDQCPQQFYVYTSTWWKWTHWAPTPLTDTWYHVVVTYDGATSMKNYVNAVEASRKTDVTGTYLPSSSPLRFGGNNQVYGGRFWHGKLDEIQFYNRVLSASEVALLYHAPSACSSPEALSQALIDRVEELVTDGTLNQGQGNSLVVKIEAAQRQMARQNTAAAVNQLGAFVNQVEAFISAGRLTSEQGQALIDSVGEIIGLLAP